MMWISANIAQPMQSSAKLSRTPFHGGGRLQLAMLQKAGCSPPMTDLGGDVTSNGISKLVPRCAPRANVVFPMWPVVRLKE
jgi:hypothetical protein